MSASPEKVLATPMEAGERKGGVEGRHGSRSGQWRDNCIKRVDKIRGGLEM